MAILYLVRILQLSNNTFIYTIIFFISVALVIAFVKPYKKTFMSFSDTALLALIALFCLLNCFNLKYTFIGGISILILFLTPMFVFIIVISARFIRMLKTQLGITNCYKSVKVEMKCESDIKECRRLLSPLQNQVVRYGAD